MARVAADWLAGTAATLRPPPKLTLSQWADEHFRLSGSADDGRWRTRPYQRGIMDAITDPAIERVTVMKSARIGWTQMMNAAIGYFMDADPCPIMVVQPTVEIAEIYSREMIAPMLRDVPVLENLVTGAAVKTSGRTLLHKTFPGGVLSMVGANSGAGFAMVSRRVVAFDEVDRYPPSAGDEGDPIALGEKRTETYWNRKIIAGSTPLIAGASRIEEMFFAGDQRRRYVPCPSCGHFDYLVFDQESERGHIMRWPNGRPHLACYECRGNGCVIEEVSKRAMDEAGEWRAEGEFKGHASFHIWSAYSTSPNARWGQIASEFVEAKKLGPEKLRTVVNTTLGETWAERGDAPEWERLYQRREPYAVGTVPDGVIVLTCGVDVQKDRLVPEVVGWGANKESWSIEIGELQGDVALTTGDNSPWVKLEALLARAFPGVDGRQFTIEMMAVDSGAFTQTVYGWCRQHPGRVMACKGIAGGMRALVDAPSKVEVTVNGKRIQRGYKVWPIGVDTAKSELYGWLQLARGDGDPPPGWCHFPEHPERFFDQLTAEHLISVVNKKTRRTKREWRVMPNRENHYLDARILARAAAAVLGIDRLKPSKSTTAGAGPGARAAAAGSGAGDPALERPGAGASSPTSARGRGGWLGRRPGGARGGGWLGRR